MLPILYEATEQDFQSNGLGRIPCTSCIVKEGRNGVYECTFTVPVTEEIYPEITEGRIIACIHDDKKDLQAFDIYGRSAPMNGLVTFYAHHISYRLSKITVKPFTASSCSGAIAAIKTNSINTNPFSFWTDKAVNASFNVATPQTARSLLAGSEGSLLDVYGKGEYEFDNWDVKLYTNRGSDNGVTIRYGKNLTDIKQDTDQSAAYNAVAPYWVSGEDGTVVTLTAGMVVKTSQVVNNQVKCIPLDLSSEFDSAPTQAQLEAKASSFLDASDAWVMKNNLVVNFVSLWQTPEYEDVAALERVSLCDKVSVVHPILGIAANKIQVIEVEYDVLNERYTRMELGEPKSTYAEVIKAEAVRTVMNQVPSTDAMGQAIAHATDMITGQRGGNIVLNRDANGKPYELLIMDTDDPNTASNVWRFNLGGLGHSHSGYSGPFNDVALTADGKINATMIATGIMIADLIKAGVLSDTQGINYINMETGEMRIGASTSIGGSTIAQHKASAVSTANGYTDEQLADYRDTVDAIVSNLQSQIDGQVMTWYYDYEPTMNNLPASQWTTAALRQQHEGDVFYWKSKGYAYRFMQTNSAWGWTMIQDTDITAAIAKADNAQDTADHKRRVFVAQPVPPYDIGDLWTQGSNGDLYRCETARASGNYVASDWKKATKYTDDTAVTALNTALDQEEIFNRLTDNGELQGIYMQDGELYINGTYVKTGTLNSLRIVNGTNNEFVVDSDGSVTAKAINIQGGSINITTQTDSYDVIKLSWINPSSQYVTMSQFSPIGVTTQGYNQIEGETGSSFKKAYYQSGGIWLYEADTKRTQISNSTIWQYDSDGVLRTVRGIGATLFYDAQSVLRGSYRPNSIYYYNDQGKNLLQLQNSGLRLYDASETLRGLYQTNSIYYYDTQGTERTSLQTEYLGFKDATGKMSGMYGINSIAYYDTQGKNRMYLTRLSLSFKDSSATTIASYRSDGWSIFDSSYNERMYTDTSHYTLHIKDGNGTLRGTYADKEIWYYNTDGDLVTHYGSDNFYYRDAATGKNRVYQSVSGMTYRAADDTLNAIYGAGGWTLYDASGNPRAISTVTAYTLKDDTGQIRLQLESQKISMKSASNVLLREDTPSNTKFYSTSGTLLTSLSNLSLTMYSTSNNVTYTRAKMSLAGFHAHDTDGNERTMLQYSGLYFKDTAGTIRATYYDSGVIYKDASNLNRAYYGYDGITVRDTSGNARVVVNTSHGLSIRDSSGQSKAVYGESIELYDSSYYKRVNIGWNDGLQFLPQTGTYESYYKYNSIGLANVNKNWFTVDSTSGVTVYHPGASNTDTGRLNWNGLYLSKSSGVIVARATQDGFDIRNASGYGVTIDGQGHSTALGSWQWKQFVSTDNTTCWIPCFVPN